MVESFVLLDQCDTFTPKDIGRHTVHINISWLNHKQLLMIFFFANYAARVVLRLHKFSHITPALAALHWLPVNRRIDFKIALLVYKALNGQALAYIADLLQPYDPPRKLRSADKQLLSQPPCRLKSYGDRTFCCAAPVVWNNIPYSVKTAKTVDSFKVKLKTHFYSVSFA